MAISRILIAGLRGGSGKTIVSLGLIASWRKRGMAVSPFKKGPDFIDAGWLALAAGRSCHNLDPFFMPAETIRSSFANHSFQSDLAVIEGNRGLYDGIDVEGTTSTSELAKLLKTPVILVIDCTKSTRTVAAMVMGCIQFDPEVETRGVILNRVAGGRHESILRKSVETYCDIPVLGAIPKLKDEPFPERHMGLVPTQEHAWAADSIDRAAEVAEKHLDLAGLLGMARQAAPDLPAGSKASGKCVNSGEPLTFSGPNDTPGPSEWKTHATRPRIGVIRDAAFQFYYPENLTALEQAGAEIVILSALADPGLPPLDGLYIGGGFPETQAKGLASNEGFRKDVRHLAEGGLPVYAECGGLIYLGEKLILKDRAYPMAGVLPVVFGFSRRPQGHGYTICEVERENPYFEVGSRIRGHEFHYSKVLSWQGNSEDLAFNMVRGGGIDGKRDGLCYKNTLATYTHIHALGTPAWAKAMVEASRRYQGEKNPTKKP
ncbi:MAG: cobyrinate a,c-diamide synthase [Deltaproteobacteria bacterium]|nr:cobyrinate a,c-diamide synthase [Deltaproteobacteria bacterium]